MTRPPHDWQTRRAQTRANALALLAQDVSAERAYEVILPVLVLAMQDSPPPETREAQAEVVAVLAAQLRQARLEQWAQAIEKLGSRGQALETDAYAAGVLVGRGAGVLCGTSPGEREFIFVRHLREWIAFESVDFVPAAENALKQETGRVKSLAAMLNERAANYRTDPGGLAFILDRDLPRLSLSEMQDIRFIDVWDDAMQRSMIMLHDGDAYEVLRRLDHAAYLTLVEDFPLRAGSYQLLYAADGWATASELCVLLKDARPAFGEDGAWIKRSKAAFMILNLLAGRLLKPLEENPPSKISGALLDEIVDALITRPDAVRLAYAWLQRVLMSPAKNRHRPAMKADGELAEALLTIAQKLAGCVGPHPDPLGWIEDELFVWRNWRIYPLLAMELYRQPIDRNAIADLIAQVLSRGLVSSVGIERIVGLPNTERTVCGLALAQIPDLANWFTGLWQRLFWERNRLRWLGHRDAMRPNIPQVLVLWTLCALEGQRASPELARPLWLAIYDAVRESMLTEAYRPLNDPWSIALRFLGALWSTIFPDDPPAPGSGSLESLVGPWRHVEVQFGQLVDILDRYQVRPDQLRRVGVSGEMLRRIVGASHVQGRVQLAPTEISSINAVAAKLDETPS